MKTHFEAMQDNKVIYGFNFRVRTNEKRKAPAKRTGSGMKRNTLRLWAVLLIITISGCSTTYKVAPVPFKSPDALGNATTIGEVAIGAKAYGDRQEARKAFGFDIIGAGMLPVQVVFDNRSEHPFEINGDQSFLEDQEGNLWSVLSREMAHQRATQNADTEQMLSQGASKGVLGAVAGALIGSAIGIVTGENIGTLAGKGAAIGGTVGLLSGGVQGYDNPEARRTISKDLRTQSLQNKTILPHTIAYGILFYPAEASQAKTLQLYLVETDTGKSYRQVFDLSLGQKN